MSHHTLTNGTNVAQASMPAGCKDAGKDAGATGRAS